MPDNMMSNKLRANRDDTYEDKERVSNLIDDVLTEFERDIYNDEKAYPFYVFDDKDVIEMLENNQELINDILDGFTTDNIGIEIRHMRYGQNAYVFSVMLKP